VASGETRPVPTPRYVSPRTPKKYPHKSRKFYFIVTPPHDFNSAATTTVLIASALIPMPLNPAELRAT